MQLGRRLKLLPAAALPAVVLVHLIYESIRQEGGWVGGGRDTRKVLALKVSSTPRLANIAFN